MLPHHLVKDKFKVTLDEWEQNKIKTQNHHDSEISGKLTNLIEMEKTF